MPMLRNVLATALVGTFVASVQAQSLADAAKKAEENRAKAKQEQAKSEDAAKAKAEDVTKSEKPSTSKVYTNQDLADVRTSSAASTPAVASGTSRAVPANPGGGGTSVATPPAGAEGKDEAWWRSRALGFRRTLADDITKLAAAHVHYDGLPEQAQGILGTPVVEAWMKAKEEISRLSAVVVNDKRALADFEEEARRAGIAPGWLREK